MHGAPLGRGLLIKSLHHECLLTHGALFVCQAGQFVAVLFDDTSSVGVENFATVIVCRHRDTDVARDRVADLCKYKQIRASLQRT